jgi:hypothetical protein
VCGVGCAARKTSTKYNIDEENSNKTIKQSNNVTMASMFVTKRDGHTENILFDKISARIEKLCNGLDSNFVNHILVAQKVIQGIYHGVTTSELDELAAQTSAAMTTSHPDYSLLAGRISVSNLHKSTKESFSETIHDLYEIGMIAEDVHGIIMRNAKALDDAIDFKKDFEYEYFGFKTLEKSYLLKIDNKIIEQQLSRAVKNYVLAYVTMTYFETISLEQTVPSTKVVFVSPKNKFKAVRHTFSKQRLSSIDFERQGRHLKKLSVEIAKLLFGSFGVEVGLYALRDYKTKLDDVSDVFLQSFAFFLDKKNSSDTGRSWFIGGKEDGECEDTDEETEKMAIVTIDG